MSAKTRKFDTRNMLLLLLIVIIIAAVAYFILTSEEGEDILTVQEVVLNKEKYINKTITVQGDFDEESLIPPTTDPDPTPDWRLNLNLTKVRNENENLSLQNGRKYKATGILMEVAGEGDLPDINKPIELWVTRIEEFG